MHSTKEEESFALTARNTSKIVKDEMRLQEEEVLSCSGEGLMPSLTKAFRAPKITHHPVVIS